MVFFEFGVDRFEEGVDEGDFYGGIYDGIFVEDILDLKREGDMLVECN